MRRRLAGVAALLISVFCTSVTANAPPEGASALAFDAEEALRISQAAIGRTLSDHVFVNRSSSEVRIRDYRGKPLLVSLIYTSCYHSCSVFTRYLGEIVEVARDALGEDAFSVVTIGFDAVNDTPARMAIYASGQGIDTSNWSFLSGDVKTMRRLTDEVGFTYAASPRASIIWRR